MNSAVFEVPKSWSGLFTDEYPQARFVHLAKTVSMLYETEEVYPPRESVFRALDLVSPENTKVVILGQDPYPAPGKAHGLSFSVVPPMKAPASLVNIFRELERTIPGWSRPQGGDLEPWARQGVLLLNTVLTVRARAPMSHAGIGWEEFCQAVLRYVQSKAPYVVFLLWGGNAAKTASSIVCDSKHTFLRWSHPSPLAQNRLPAEERFVGNNHFVETNRLLIAHGRSPIDWRLNE